MRPVSTSTAIVVLPPYVPTVVYFTRSFVPEIPSTAVFEASVPSVGVAWVVTGVRLDRLKTFRADDVVK
jgi:hypothetical protein